MPRLPDALYCPTSDGCRAPSPAAARDFQVLCQEAVSQNLVVADLSYRQLELYAQFRVVTGGLTSGENPVLRKSNSGYTKSECYRMRWDRH